MTGIEQGLGNAGGGLEQGSEVSDTVNWIVRNGLDKIFGDPSVRRSSMQVMMESLSALESMDRGIADNEGQRQLNVALRQIKGE